MCPNCGGELRSRPSGYQCRRCGQRYDVQGLQTAQNAAPSSNTNPFSPPPSRARRIRGRNATLTYIDEVQDIPPPPRWTQPQARIEDPYAAYSPPPDRWRDYDGTTQEGGPVLSTLTLPAGWRWSATPDASAGYVEIEERYVTWDGAPSAGRAAYTERIAAFKEWVEANNLKVRVYRQQDVQLREDPAAQTGWEVWVTAPKQFLVCTTRYWNYNYGNADWLQAQDGRAVCSQCGTQHPIGALRCPTTELPNYCGACGRDGVTGVQWSDAHQSWYCDTCAWECGECGASVPPNNEYCTDCRTREQCTHCRTVWWLEPSEDTHIGADGLCLTCIERRCSQCNEISRHALQWSPADERFLCRNCWRESLTDLLEDAAEDDNDVALIESIPGRENIRMCGLELEGGNGTGGNGSTLARELYREGLSQYNDMQGYHHGNGSFIHVEADSSVDWEVVIGPLNPADDQQMDAVNRAIRLIRRGIHDKRYKLDLRCGLHVHVGASGFGLAQAYNLNTLFSYVEDVMFRLAAAKWPIHRSMTGSPYCEPVAKSTSKLAFGREVGQNEERDARRVALNFRNYFHSMLRGCQCGAVRFDAWEDCTCDLGKCTFEFRLFNATANPRKLHAYLALSQALVAKAGTLPEIKNPQDEFPPHTFIAKPFKGMNESEQEAVMETWPERLRWLLNELPLTDDERQSVLYCVRNSDLAVLGDAVIDSLVTTSTPEEVPA